MKILINYHGNQKIDKIAVGDWIDLRNAEDVFMETGEFKKISLGVSMRLPEGYEAHLAPRSSTLEKHGILMPGIGVIDNCFSGNDDIWSMPVIAIRDTTILAGTRIAQFRIMPVQPVIEFIEVDYLEGPNRGGFGTTGIN